MDDLVNQKSRKDPPTSSFIPDPRVIDVFGPPIEVLDSQHPGGSLHPSNYRTAEDFVRSWRSLWHPRAACGGRSYALVGSLADLEQALIDYALYSITDNLRKRASDDPSAVASWRFLDNVQDILPLSTTRACGVEKDRSAHPIQYHIGFFDGHENIPPKQAQLCLSGTAEMGIADKLKDQTFHTDELPMFLVAESRCFRPEISQSSHETGLYRVHEFTKIEIFAVCTESQSESVLEDIISFQKALISPLGLRCRVLEMTDRNELGPAASRKIDVEAWMPGRKYWGELTSASNCTDYQASRLGIKYSTADGFKKGEQFSPHRSSDEATISTARTAHTCNGTVLAVPRMIIALLETYQKQKGRLQLPEVIKSWLSQNDAATKSTPLRVSKASPFVYNRQ